VRGVVHRLVEALLHLAGLLPGGYGALRPILATSPARPLVPPKPYAR